MESLKVIFSKQSLKLFGFFLFLMMYNLSFAQKGKTSSIPEIIPQRLAIIDTIWGEVVHDPYRWMENLENDSLKNWIGSQNDFTSNFLQKDLGRLNDIISKYGRIYYTPYVKNGKYYFVRMNINSEKPSVLYSTSNLEKLPIFLFDPSKIEKSKEYAIYDYEISEDDSKLAVQLEEGGSDWKTIRVFDMGRKKWLTDILTHVRYSNLKWHGDGFFYNGYVNSQLMDVFNTQIREQGLYYHKIGTPQNEDVLIYKSSSDDVFNFDVSTRGNYLILYLEEIKDNKTIKIISQTSLPLQENFEFKEFIYTKDSSIFLKVIGENDQGLIVESNFQAPNSALYVFNPNQKNKATLLVPENSAQLLNSGQYGQYILISYLEGEDNILAQYDINGMYLNALKIEKGSMLNGITGSQKDDIVIFTFTSFFEAPSVYSLNLQTFKSAKVDVTKVNFNNENLITKNINFYSKDSTIIPMFLTYRKDLDLSKRNPTLLYGYGGFGIPTYPFFNSTFIAFMQNKGILAVPQLRGGGDFPGWHEQGMKHKKQNTIDDFIASSEYLIENYSTSDQLATIGGSNGGLVVLSAMIQRPDLFKAVISNAGLTDMTRYHLFNIGYSYKDEYGSPEDSLDFKYLYQYSPLHNLNQNVIYPSTLLMTGINDDRVHSFHSFKMQASLQQLSKAINPHLMYVGANFGHCNCGNSNDRAEVDTYILNYLFKMLNMEKFP